MSVTDSNTSQFTMLLNIYPNLSQHKLVIAMERQFFRTELNQNCEEKNSILSQITEQTGETL